MAKIDRKEIVRRVISACVLGPVALGVIYLGGLPYALVVLLLAMLGIHEWLHLTEVKKTATRMAAYIFMAGILGIGIFASVYLAVLCGIVLMLVLFVVAAREMPDRAGWVVLGLPYLGGSCLALLYLRNVPDIGMALTYYLVLVVWATDIGAYVAGRSIGGPKLAPAISPSKTWAGLIGGMALAAVIGYAVAIAFMAREPATAFSLAILIAVISQLGDLFESSIKRRSGMKDSGALIPGHGGILDRIDGLVFAATFFVLFQMMPGANYAWW